MCCKADKQFIKKNILINKCCAYSSSEIMEETVRRFFDQKVAGHEALTHEHGDLRPLLYQSVQAGKIHVRELEQLGEMIRQALAKRIIESNRISVGVKLAHGHMNDGKHSEAMDELRTAFFWSNPENLKALEKEIRRRGHRIVFENELPASFGHVVSGTFNDKPAIFKITPILRPVDEAAKVANLLRGLPVARQLGEYKTPLLPSRLEILEKLTGSQAGEAVAGGANVKEVYRSMGKTLARLHSHEITPEIDRKVGKQRVWETVTKGAKKTAEEVGRQLELPEGQIAALKKAFETPIEAPERQALLHNDYHEENVLVGEDSKVSGLIDFSPKKGDAMYDLAKALWYARRAREMYGGSFADNAKWLAEGYKAVRTLTSEEKRRLRYFSLFISVKFGRSQIRQFRERAPIIKKLLLEDLSAVQRSS